MYTKGTNMTIQELENSISFYGKDIYSFCVHLTNSRELADDLYQDTFLEVMKKISDINNKANPKSYFLSIAVIHCFPCFCFLPM